MTRHHTTPPDYEKKFASFIKLCADARGNGIEVVLVAEPWVLGDTYEEMTESLLRVAKAGLSLQIGNPKEAGKRKAEEGNRMWL